MRTELHRKSDMEETLLAMGAVNTEEIEVPKDRSAAALKHALEKLESDLAPPEEHERTLAT